MIRQWQWLQEVRALLPEQGAAQLMVAHSDGLSYLRLDRGMVDRSVAAARRLLLVVAATLAVLFLVVLLLGWALTSSMRAHSAMRQDLTRLLVSSQAEEISGAQAISALREQTDESSAALRNASARDEAFRLYVAATQHLLELDNQRQADMIKKTGLEMPARQRVPSPTGVGGSSLSSESTSALSKYLSPALQDLLLLNQDLRAFLADLPHHPPMLDARVTSGYGVRRHPISGTMELHAGLDLVSDVDPSVRAAAAGVVTFAGWQPGYGRTVNVVSRHGIEMVYAHLADIDVRVDQQVQAGALIGRMGSSGSSTGPHLHFEVRQGSRSVDPFIILKKDTHVQAQTR